MTTPVRLLFTPVHFMCLQYRNTGYGRKSRSVLFAAVLCMQYTESENHRCYRDQSPMKRSISARNAGTTRRTSARLANTSSWQAGES